MPSLLICPAGGWVRKARPGRLAKKTFLNNGLGDQMNIVKLIAAKLLLLALLIVALPSTLWEMGRQTYKQVYYMYEVKRAAWRGYVFRRGMVAPANTLTNLLPLLYQSLDVISREMVGFIPAVTRDTGVERVALNQTVNIYVAPAIAGANVTPGTTPPSDGDMVFGNRTMTISKSRYWPVRWTGEEQRQVGTTGQMSNVLRDQFTQAFRAAVNEVEIDLGALHVQASRAYGTAGTTPFGTASDLSDFAQPHLILDDNGAPVMDRQLVLGNTAIANIRGKQASLFRVNEAGTAELLRNGIINRVEGYDIHASGGVVASFVKGTGSAYTTSGTLLAVGTTSIPLITGTGTVLAGDVVTFAGDSNKYVVTTGIAAPGTIVIAEPGLRVAIPASATAMTIGNTSARNMAFSRSAIALATRAPALPDGGDMAADRTFITDPVSGISFEVSLYRQYRQIKYEIALAWGVQMIAPRHTAILLG